MECDVAMFPYQSQLLCHELRLEATVLLNHDVTQEGVWSPKLRIAWGMWWDRKSSQCICI